MTKHISHIRVPNLIPKDWNGKLACIGESPGWEEESNKSKKVVHGIETEYDDPQPFVGIAGEKLMQCLNRNAIPRESVFLGNLCKHRPAGNKFETLIQTDELLAGLNELYDELRELQPNVIVACGAWPMWFFTGKCGKDKGKLKPGHGILERRGSIFPCVINGLENTKVVCTLHPSFVSRNAEYYPAFDQDIKRAISESQYKEFRTHRRNYIINPTVADLEILRVHITKDRRAFLAIDIETFGDTLACVGVATSPYNSVCIPYTSIYNKDFIEWLLSTENPKGLQFGSFDTEYLRSRGLTVVNYQHDSFILQRVLWPMMPRTLAYMTSIHTDIPFYKDEGKEALSDSKRWGVTISKNLNQLYTYNCKDCVATYEVIQDLLAELEERKHLKKIYDFDMEASKEDALEISRNGMLVDEARREQLRLALMKQWAKHQRILNAVAGEQMGKKLQYIPDVNIPMYMNANSWQQVRALLYKKFGIRERKNRDGSVTSDEQALLSILQEAKKEYDVKVQEKAKDKWLRILIATKAIVIIRGIRKKISSYINVDLSKDGRIRSLYKLGPSTARWSAEKWIDDTGLNAQTFPRDKVEVEV